MYIQVVEKKMFLALYIVYVIDTLGERQPLSCTTNYTKGALELCIKLIIHVAYS